MRGNENAKLSVVKKILLNVSGMIAVCVRVRTDTCVFVYSRIYRKEGMWLYNQHKCITSIDYSSEQPSNHVFVTAWCACFLRTRNAKPFILYYLSAPICHDWDCSRIGWWATLKYPLSHSIGQRVDSTSEKCIRGIINHMQFQQTKPTWSGRILIY
jgi:hypothetical protein